MARLVQFLHKTGGHAMHIKSILGAAAAIVLAATGASAGPVFLTGHDPDFHAQGGVGAQILLTTALNFVTSNTTFTPGHKFLYVQSDVSPPVGFLDGRGAFTALGLTQGVNYDQVDASGLAALPNFSAYSAIVVASDFGAMLRDAEIQQLVSMKTQIANFINAGGGLAAFAECGPGFPNCDSSNVNSSTPLFGFLPVTVTSVGTAPPYHVTGFGSSLGLVDGDVNDPTHNSFGLIGGLKVVDQDSNGTPTTLAGNVTIHGGHFDAPEPISVGLFGAGLFGAGLLRRRRR
jgi:hypothetical protein